MSRKAADLQVRRRLAELSGTRPEDWYLVFKARYGMKVVFEQLFSFAGPGDVVTQAFTCATAVDPITASGLDPVYVDVDPETIMVDPNLVQPTERTRALVMQHTFGIMAPEQSRALAQVARDNDLLLVEDSAHCLSKIALDEAGRPLADVSVHSFGIEKLLPTRFGGAIWLNPEMKNRELRAHLDKALSSLKVVGLGKSVVSRAYRIQNGVLNRLPLNVGNRLKAPLAKVGLFEAPIVDAERRGQLPGRATQPSDWMLKAMLHGLSQFNAVEKTRTAATEFFGTALSTEGIYMPKALSSADPLVRFPFFTQTPGQAERVISAVNQAGFFAGHWYRPLLFPGPLGPGLRFDPNGTDLPVTRSLASRVVNLQTNTDLVTCEQTANVVLAALGKAASARGDRYGNEDFVPVLLGTGLGAYAMARSFHERYGVRSLALGRARLDETADSSIIDVRTYDNFDDPDFIVETLQSLKKELGDRKLLLIPTIEFYTNVVSERAGELGSGFAVPLPDQDLVSRLIDKVDFYKECKELGLPYPETDVLTYEEHQNGMPNWADFQFPLIIKPADTDTYQRAIFEGRKKIYRVETPQEASDVVKLIYSSAYRGDLVLQELMGGAEEVMRVVNTYSDQQGKTRFVSVGQVLLTEVDPARVGNNTAIATVEDHLLATTVRDFLDAVGYKGIANFDFMFDQATGTYKALEANLRAGATHFYTAAGDGNLAEHMVQDLIYDSPLPYQENSREGLWVNLPTTLARRLAPRAIRDNYGGVLRQDPIHTLDYGPDSTLRRKLRKARLDLKRSLDHAKYGRSRLNK